MFETEVKLAPVVCWLVLSLESELEFFCSVERD